MCKAEKWTLAWVAVTILVFGGLAWSVAIARRPLPPNLKAGSVDVPTSAPAAAEPTSEPVATKTSTAAPARSFRDRLWYAVTMVESGGDATAIGDGGNAVGIAQIWKIVVDDCNRIVRQKRWTYDDRKNVKKSREMFDVYLSHYAGTQASYQKCARICNGEPRGYMKSSTAKYWQKVQKYLYAPQAAQKGKVVRASQKPQERSEASRVTPPRTGRGMGLTASSVAQAEQLIDTVSISCSCSN
jgi:hypothetical protein